MRRSTDLESSQLRKLEALFRRTHNPLPDRELSCAFRANNIAWAIARLTQLKHGVKSDDATLRDEGKTATELLGELESLAIKFAVAA